MTTRREFTKAFKQTPVRRLESGRSAAEVARALQVHPSDLQVERKIGQQAMEIDFLKRALQHVEEQRRLRARKNGSPSTSRSRRK